MMPPPLPSRRRQILLCAIVLVVLGGLALRGAPVSLADIRASLLRFEGYTLTPYRDGPAYSVGVGHNLTANGQKARHYTPIEVEAFLLRDVSWSIDCCRSGVAGFDDLPPPIQLAVIHVAFGCGRVGFHRFYAFRSALSRRSYPQAARQLAASRWASQVSPARRDWALTALLTPQL